MKTSAEQNSAVVLSLWHCMLPRLYADIANNPAKVKNLMEDKAHKVAMVDIYTDMKPLRFTVHGHNHPIPGFSILETAQLVNFMASGIPSEVWAKELHSLMQDLEVMNTVLKDYGKQGTTGGLDDDDKSSMHVDQALKQPKETICLLTIWYWLAAWSTHELNPSSQNEFINRMDLEGPKLGAILTHGPSFSNSYHHEIHDLYIMLLEMLKSDVQHWTHVLDHFLDKMVDAGLLRGQVKEVLHASGAIHGGSIMPLATAGALPVLLDAPMAKKSMMVKMSSKMGGLLKQGLKQLAISAVLDMLVDVVVHTFNDIKHSLGDIESGLEDFSHHAIEIAKKIAYKAREVTNKVIDEVKNVAHIIGEGFHYVAHNVQMAYHSVRHFFSHLFGH